MKRFVSILALLGLLVACRPKGNQETNTKTATPDTAAVVDDDTLENATAGSTTLDSTIVAVATLPDPATADAGASPTNFRIIPGQQAGMITATATESSLIQTVGKINVTHEAIELGEGDSEPGTTLFKGTANEVHILWKDKKQFANPDAVLIKPTRDETTADHVAPSWLIDNGLKIGSTLKDVERANGKPFKLYGFGWDRGGSLSDTQGGRLGGADGKAYLSLTFGLGSLTPAQEKLAGTVSGDSEFSSSLPALQKLNPTVETILVRFK